MNANGNTSKSLPPITWAKVCGHLRTITEHKLLVMEHCFRIGLYRQGLMHDLSKYMPSELFMGFRYYDDGKSSPNNGERKLKGYSDAWMHHKGRNRHHFEYWTDYSPKTRRIEPVKMPLRYVVEMFCDRVAASRIYGGKNYTDDAPLRYFLKGKATRRIHPETSAFLERLLRMLADRGEAYTFAWIRRYLATHDDY